MATRFLESVKETFFRSSEGKVGVTFGFIAGYDTESEKTRYATVKLAKAPETDTPDAILALLREDEEATFAVTFPKNVSEDERWFIQRKPTMTGAEIADHLEANVFNRAGGAPKVKVGPKVVPPANGR